VEEIARKAGRDLAILNNVLVDGFGWIRRASPETGHLQAEWPAHRTFALEHWEADIAYLAEHVLEHSEVTSLEQAISRYDSWLAGRWYDLGHFHMRDGEFLPFHLLPALVAGYRELAPLPSTYEQHIRFTSLLTNVRALVRSLQKRPPNRFTEHQLKMIREDLVNLL